MHSNPTWFNLRTLLLFLILSSPLLFSQLIGSLLAPHPRPNRSANTNLFLPLLFLDLTNNSMAYATNPSQTTAAPNANATNTNSNYNPDFSPAALSALNFNPSLASIPPTLQDTPMPTAMSNHSNMASSTYTTPNHPPTNNSPLRAGDYIAQWQANHINTSQNMTTYDGSHSPFSLDMNLIVNSGIAWSDMPQLNQGTI